MKFSMPHSTLLIIIFLFSLSVGLFAYSTEDPISKAEGKRMDEKIINPLIKSETGISADYTLSSKSSQTAGFYFVQAESNFTRSNSLQTNLEQPNSTDTTDISSNDHVTGNSVPEINDSPLTESKGALRQKTTTVKCEGSALCITGEVVKVINGKTFYVNIQNKVYKVELALIELPVQSEQAMRAATTFTRNTCLGSNVLIDQDDRQKVNSFIAQVYCSPTKNLNSLLLQTGYVQLDKSQCPVSEFANLNWAKTYGC